MAEGSADPLSQLDAMLTGNPEHYMHFPYALIDEFHEQLQKNKEVEPEDPDAIIARYCYVLVEVPGASSWFMEEFETEDVSCTKKKRPDYENKTSLQYLAKFYGDKAGELKLNTVIDFHGYFSGPTLQGKSSEPNIGSVHILDYKIVNSSDLAKGLESVTDDMSCVRDILKRNLTSLLGDSVSASYLLANILSTTYARPEGVPICSMPLSIVGVTDSEPIISFLKNILPMVKVLQYTSHLLRNVRFSPAKDYEKDILVQGELQLSNGTMLIIDETKLTDWDRTPRNREGHDSANLETLEQLIKEQRVSYDYNFYKIPMEVDYPMVMMSKKTPFVYNSLCTVPLVHSAEISTVTRLDLSGLNIIRRYIQHVRGKLCRISISAENCKMVTENFAEMNKDGCLNKTDLLSEFLHLARITAASEGSNEITSVHWKNAVEMAAARRRLMNEYNKL